MKYFGLMLAVMTFAATGFSQKGDKYTLKGTLSKYADSKEQLMVRIGRSSDAVTGELIAEDSCKLANGRFEFTGVAPEPFLATLNVVTTSNTAGATVIDWGRLWIEKGNIVITANGRLEDAMVKGSSTDALSREYQRMVVANSKRAEELRASLRGKETDSFYINTVYKPKMEELSAEFQRWERQFIESHPKSYFSLVGMETILWGLRSLKSSDRLTKDMINRAEALYNGLDQSIRGTSLGQQIKKELAGLSAANAGDAIIHFAMKGIDGQTVDTRKLLGRVFLIDFWGSWCPSCRASHPHLKELYEAYRHKGFEIIGVSAEFGNEEQQMRNWKKAVKEDAVPWLQVLNGKEDNDLVIKYGVGAFPTKLLVDRDGKILLRVTDDGKKELDHKLKELFQ